MLSNVLRIKIFELNSKIYYTLYNPMTHTPIKTVTLNQ